MIKSKIILLIAADLILAANNFGQSGKIASILFSSVTEKAIEKSHVFPRRHIVTEETYANGKIIKTNSLIWEAVSDDEYKITQTEKIDDRITKLETINIGSDVYKRENEGDWKKEEWKFEHGLTRQLNEFLGCFEFSVEETVFNNQNVKIYESFSINNDIGGLYYEQERYWIDNSGTLLKQETTYGLLNPRNIIWHKTLIHEYDANTKIEAPIKP